MSLPREFVTAKSIRWARYAAQLAARSGLWTCTEIVASLRDTICRKDTIWTVEDQRLVEAAAIDGVNQTRWKEVGR
jgi:hypothetical protein